MTCSVADPFEATMGLANNRNSSAAAVYLVEVSKILWLRFLDFIALL